MNLRFTKKQEEYIAQQVATGEYQNNRGVICYAIRVHRIYRDKVIEDLRKEIEKGWHVPDTPGTMDEIIASKNNGW